jgi:hypothetical protein
MIQPEPQKEKKGFLQRLPLGRLPKLGRLSQLMLLVGIFLIVFIALWMVHQAQAPKQVDLESRRLILERVLAGSGKQEGSKDKLEAQLSSITAETETASAVFYTQDRGPEIMNRLLELAQLYDISVVKTEQSASDQTITIGDNTVTYQVLTFTLDLKGQVAEFQNFLLALESKLPTSEIKEVTITVAEKKGEEDTATVNLDVFCYGSSK